MKATLEIENLGNKIRTIYTSNTNKIQEMKEKISGVEGTIEEIDTSVKENTKCKKVLTQNIQEIWNRMKRPNLRIIRIEEGEDFQLKVPETIFNKIIEGIFPNLKKEIAINVQTLIEHPIGWIKNKYPLTT